MPKKKKKNWRFPKPKTPAEFAKETGCSIEKAEKIYEAIRSGNYVWSKNQLDNE